MYTLDNEGSTTIEGVYSYINVLSPDGATVEKVETEKKDLSPLQKTNIKGMTIYPLAAGSYNYFSTLYHDEDVELWEMEGRYDILE